MSEYSCGDKNNDTNNSADEDRICWVCLGTDADEPDAEWVSPCRCSGGTKWVHQACLHQWIDEKQAGNGSKKIKCPQCRTEYDLVCPPQSRLCRLIEWFDKTVDQFCPFFGGGLLVGTVYWTATTYGAITVMQVFGHQNGLRMMEKTDPANLLIGLPTIPVLLIASRLVSWDEYILQTSREIVRSLRRLSNSYWLFSRNDQTRPTFVPRLPTQRSLMATNTSITRLINGALALPTVAVIVGRVMFGHVNSQVHRTLMGGATFIFLKGLVRMYNSSCEYQRQAYRIIRNFDPNRTNLNEIGNINEDDGEIDDDSQDGDDDFLVDETGFSDESDFEEYL